ncbi:DegT/DnrJ/EryC1/StrS family aminotransferase [Solitalea koreensis]|uniref:dTDP-4-amino-4,6-dideoxygalactose transaminase n=1 Tax=Solitalea koreensis TaxID=543615 RepID=A0A521AMW2_9SPHI|nr:DegT/DnrJ/EryC1/StrS aminotransferase family protein [Solitalea koreensis]SMO36174.1 dTDP-4-amino-4,6-dideoxygalactose transaminase [Solitalea koreensis]
MSIPFSPPRIDQKIIDEVVNAMKSGWITTGPKTKLFEKELAEYTGVPAVLCLNSATAGLELALRWFGVQEGDEVILPAYTYCATANVVVHCGAKPVFVDINADDFNISVSEIAKHITTKTKVIMPVDFGGMPCDYDAINALVNAHRVKDKFVPRNEIQHSLGRIMVLSDAAHSIGGKYQNNKVGGLADLSVISFHAVKNLTTAEGGAMCFNLPTPFDNHKVYNDLVIKSLHGQNKDALAKVKPGAWKYDIVEPGYKYNMTDILASIGLVELARYDNDTLPKRKYVCDRYSKLLKEYSWAQLPIFEDIKRESSYHLYPLRIVEITEKQRDGIIAMIAEAEIAVNVHFIPLPMMSFYKQQGYDISDYVVSYDNYSREISLPVFYDLNDRQIEEVVNVLIDSVERVVNKVSI